MTHVIDWIDSMNLGCIQGALDLIISSDSYMQDDLFQSSASAQPSDERYRAWATSTQLDWHSLLHDPSNSHTCHKPSIS